jgi:hypothetical protein
MVKNPPLWWYQNCAIALDVKLEEILDYEHSGWPGSPQAPKPPPPGRLDDRQRSSAAAIEVTACRTSSS